MATKEQELTETQDLEGPSSEWLVEAYRTMVTSRRVDDREISLNRQNKTFFQISCAGHEAVQVAMADHLRPGYDWFHPYYRDRALVLALGQTPLDHLLGAIGARDDPNSAGRQMPSHFSDPGLHIVTMSSPTGTQFLQAVGAAEVGYRVSLIPELQNRIVEFEEDEVVLVCSGEGATSEGEFWEALNTACNLKLPVIFLIEDNEYAISVPVEVNTAGGSISKLVSGFPDLFIVECDGTDVLDSHQATGQAVRHCRLRRGPALVHCHTIRPYSHSLSDDERIYRPAAELEEAAAREPLLRTRNLLIERGVATPEQLDRLEEEVETEVAAAAAEASTRPQPVPETALLHLYSEEVDPTSESFNTEDSPQFGDGRPLTMVDLLNACLGDEMERDHRIVLFGQDIADASREPALEEVKGKGGCSKSRTGSSVDSVGVEYSTRLWPKPTSSGGPSAWHSEASGRWSRSSSSTTSGQRSCKFETSWPPSGIAPMGSIPHRS